MFRDRVDAGRQLAESSERRHLENEDVVVLGLPRGGVPVAFEVAHALDQPLDIIVVRKLGVPFQPELAMGAIGEEGVRILNRGDAAVRSYHRERARRGGTTGTGRARTSQSLLPWRPTSPSPSSGVPQLWSTTGSPLVRLLVLPARLLEHLGAARVVMAAPVASRSSVTELTGHL